MLFMTLFFMAGLLVLLMAFVLFLIAISPKARPATGAAPPVDDERRMLLLVAGANDIGLPFAIDSRAGAEFGPVGPRVLADLLAQKLIYGVRESDTQGGYCLTTAGERLVESWPERHPGREAKYGAVASSRKKFHAGEPVFVLRATDPVAPDAVQAYALRCHYAKCGDEFVADVRKAADAMRTWQRENPALVKQRPD